MLSSELQLLHDLWLRGKFPGLSGLFSSFVSLSQLSVCVFVAVYIHVCICYDVIISQAISSVFPVNAWTLLLPLICFLLSSEEPEPIFFCRPLFFPRVVLRLSFHLLLFCWY